VIAVSWVLFGIGFGLVGAFTAVYLYELGAPVWAIGAVFGIYAIGNIPTYLAGGVLADQYNRRNLVVYMTFVVVAIMFGYAIAPTWWVFAILQLFDALCHLYMPALHALLWDALPADRRGLGLSIAKTAISAPGLVMPVVGGWLYSCWGLLGLRIGWLAAGVCGVVAAAYRFRLKETLPSPRPITLRAFWHAMRRGVTELVEVARQISAFRALLASVLTLSVSAGLLNPILPVHAIVALGIPPEFFGLAVTASSWLAVVLALPVGSALDKLGRKPLAVVRCLIIAAAAVGLALVTTPMVVVGLIAAYSAGASLRLAFEAWTIDLTTPEVRGRAAALYAIAGFLGSATGSVLGGALYVMAASIPFLASAILAIAALAAILVV